MPSVQVDKRWLLAGLLIGGAGTYAVVRTMTRRPRITSETRLMLVGDSLAVGLNLHLKELATTIGVPYVSLAKEGTRVDQWLTSDVLADTLEEFQPTLVLVSLGTNDAFSQIDPESQAAAQDALLDALEDGSEVVWIGAPALPQKYLGKSPDERMLAALREGPDHYFDSHDLEIPRGPDGLHPTAGGYGGWAGSIWEWLT